MPRRPRQKRSEGVERDPGSADDVPEVEWVADAEGGGADHLGGRPRLSLLPRGDDGTGAGGAGMIGGGGSGEEARNAEVLGEEGGVIIAGRGIDPGIQDGDRVRAQGEAGRGAGRA